MAIVSGGRGAIGNSGRAVMAVRYTRDIGTRNAHSTVYMAENIHHGVVRWTASAAAVRQCTPVIVRSFSSSSNAGVNGRTATRPDDYNFNNAKEHHVSDASSCEFSRKLHEQLTYIITRTTPE